MQAEKKRYFVPNQLVFCLKHSAALDLSRIDNVIKKCVALIDSVSVSAASFEAQTRTFVDGDSALSYVFVTVDGLDNSTYLTRHKGVQQSIDRVSRVLNGTAHKYTTEQRTAAEDLETIFTEEEIKIVSVLPNWHGGNAQAHGIPVGGPGARPVIPTGNPSSGWQYSYFAPTGGSNPAADAIKALLESGGGSGVKVAILDTLPRQICSGNDDENDPREGDADLVTNIPTLTNNPLMESLRTSNKLTLTSYKSIAKDSSIWDAFRLTQPGNVTTDVAIEGHEYEMPDHGLFSTGIIHSIAPQAELNLIQMLNDYGVGTMQSLIDALYYVYTTYCFDESGNPTSDKVLLNCSFVLAVSEDEKVDIRDGFPTVRRAHRIDPDFATIAQSLRGLAPGASDALDPLFSLLRRHGVLMVAAAGNEGDTGQGRTPARLPAALATVVGVGALVKMGASGYTDFDYTSYSNLADMPLSDGFLVFGGNAVNSPLEADPVEGMLGLYLNTFPGSSFTGENDTNGWARWAGTSFAAPIVTGILALQLASGKSVTDALTDLREAKSENVTGNSHSHILEVRQG